MREIYSTAIIVWRKIPVFGLICTRTQNKPRQSLIRPYGTFGMEPASIQYVYGQEKAMQSETFFDSIKRNLNGEPGQPIVLGVCKTLAARFNQEVWLIRLAAIVLGVFYSFITLVVYILLGLFMEETSHRTKSLFEGLGIWFREFTEKVGGRLGEIFGRDDSTHRNRHT
jgi:phage shock protein PspC (stress-responsive transcriptional regulator)